MDHHQQYLTLEDIDDEQSQIEAQLRELQAELSVLRRLRSRLVHTSDDDDHDGLRSLLDVSPLPSICSGALARSQRSFGGSQTGATEMIFHLVEQNPGVTPGEVADELLERGIESAARDPKRSFYNMAIGLVSRGRLHRDDDGGLYLIDQD